MKTLLPLLLFAGALIPAGSAAPLERDLGHGLVYYRVHALPADLPPADSPRGPLVLDLRFARADDGATVALGAWLKTRGARAPVLVLMNDGTAAVVLSYFSAHDPVAGLITLGTPGAGFTPDIALRVHPDAERTAYDALEHGTAVESLLTDPTSKPRHDEASMAQERTAPEESTDTDSDIANPGEPAAVVAAAPRPVIDYVLLRAVHLHRALLALRKL